MAGKRPSSSSQPSPCHGQGTSTAPSLTQPGLGRARDGAEKPRERSLRPRQTKTPKASSGLSPQGFLTFIPPNRAHLRWLGGTFSPSGVGDAAAGDPEVGIRGRTGEKEPGRTGDLHLRLRPRGGGPGRGTASLMSPGAN